MAGQEGMHDPTRAQEYKEKGNSCFNAGDYVGAEALYTKAINHDSANHQLYTNRAMASLKLTLYDSVIKDSLQAITLFPNSMKAYYNLAQAETALRRTKDALASSKKAHQLCVSDIQHGNGRNPQRSLGPITELVLKCKKDDWERREKERTMWKNALLVELQRDLEEKKYQEVRDLQGRSAGEVEIQETEREFDEKISLLKSTFEAAGEAADKRRTVPDWLLDDITFSVMLDPVTTLAGQSYERSSILEHLKWNPTDPLTRQPMTVHDLRPNIALKEACAEFLEENGWAIDW